MPSSDIAFCLSEDRTDCETGLRLAILGLCNHCPSTPVYVYRPECGTRFGEWVKQFPQVTWIPSTPVGGETWNCKPQALKPLLAKGYRQVVWVDSDILVTRDCRSLFTDLDDRILAVAQDPSSAPHQGNAIRTRGWDMTVSRSLTFTLNSAVLRITKFHLPLLDRWTACMADPRYIAAQNVPLDARPLHMMSDQDVLNALIGAPEFADIPLRVFGTATEIIHAGGALGYSSRERLRGLFKAKPTFLHAIAGKPWLWLGGTAYWSQRNFFGWYRRLLQELSPYVSEAVQYRSQLGEDAGWMDKRTTTGMLLRGIGFGHFALRALPVALAAGLIETAKGASQKAQKSRTEAPLAGTRPEK